MRTNIAVLKLVRGAALHRRTRPHTAIYVSSYCCMCPDTAICGRATRTRGAATAANASSVFAASALQAHRSERERERERPYVSSSCHKCPMKVVFLGM
jgi:hypothetical protein